MSDSEINLETTPPMNEEEYARDWSAFADVSDEYEVMPDGPHS